MPNMRITCVFNVTMPRLFGRESYLRLWIGLTAIFHFVTCWSMAESLSSDEFVSFGSTCWAMGIVGGP